MVKTPHKPRHTFNKLKNDLKHMNTQEKQERLKELQEMLMAERGKEKSNAFFGIDGGQKNNVPHQTWVIRKQIAIIKTSIHVKGFHYNPR